MTINMPYGAKFIIERLNKHGHSAHIVGGSVRDALLGNAPNDFDITTSALPGDMKRIFSDMRLIETGIAHGTVTILIDDIPYEVTTYRIDGEYDDSRHPRSVSFTSRLEDDLARRDFTVNAMAYNDVDGISDPFGGRADLSRCLIRAVGEPALRFGEDALRILRALRFSAKLGFSIEKDTACAMREKLDLLKDLSAERVYIEWVKLLCGNYAYRVISENRDIIAKIVPELGEIKMPAEAAFSGLNWVCRQIALFYLNSGVAAYSAAMHRLHSPRDIERDGVKILECIDKLTSADERAVRLLYIGYEFEILCLAAFIGYRIGAHQNNWEPLLNKLKDSGLASHVSELDISGQDILALGVKGPTVGKTLSALLRSVALGECENEKVILLSLARAYISGAK